MIRKSVNSFITTIELNQEDFIGDDAKRFYAIPREFRSVENPYENEPAIIDVEDFHSPFSDELKEIMRIAQLLYWRVLADDAEHNKTIGGHS